MKVIALQGIRGGVGTTAIVAGLAQAAHEQGQGYWRWISARTTSLASTLACPMTIREAGVG
ncbi:hypothetical protein KAM479c_07390 (plasmid) [Aeromonas caviae]|nr:hypothetical protein KAM479c_07390 [Aeromonas caviae]